MKLIATFVPLLFFAVSVESLLGEPVTPLEHAHAHNDYLHKRPLSDALDRGFTSVEADIWLVADKLLVGHDQFQLRPERTLESLYLTPLARRVRTNSGHVYPKASRFFLLIDVKSDAVTTYRRLEKDLAEHADMLTTITDGKVRPGAITVVLTGAQARKELLKANPRYAGLDGRIADLESDAPANVFPMISGKWETYFSWTGEGPFPDRQRTRLKEFVRKAHARGRAVRFWATPESERVWKELRSADVDLINTDQLDRLADFLRKKP
jgi:hypothetical protein